MALRCLRYRIQTGRRPIYGNVIARSGAIQKPGLMSAGSLRASAFAFELWRTGTLLAMTGEIEAGSRNGLNALDHVLVFRAVFVPDRFDRVLERRLVRYLDDLAAGGLGFFQRLLFVLIPVFAFFELGFAGEFLDQVLVVGRQRVPDPL